MEKAIIVKNLTKEYYKGQKPKNTLKEYFVNPFKKVKRKKFKAIDDISFEVKKGEFFGIIGRNGSGKSTILKMIAGIIEPSAGMVEVNGKMVPFLELGVGFNPDLTARENIFLNGAILGMSRELIERKFDEIIAFAEVEDFIDTQIKNFSSGMYVRLAFAIAIQTEADIYIIDEILAVGDYGFQKKCFDIFKDLKKQGKTFLFVSHDLESVQEFCDRVMYIKFGEVMNIGKSAPIVEDYVINDRKENRETNKGGDIGADILNMKDEKINSVVNQSKFKIRVNYRLKPKVLEEDLVVGISIWKGEDMHIFGTNSSIEKVDLKFSREGKVDFIITDFPFIQGNYNVTAAIHNKEGKNFVWKNKLANINVVKNLPYSGLVRLKIDIQQ